MTGEELLKEAIEETHQDVHNGNAPALDPASIIAIITAIFEGIRLCRNPEAASRQIQRGGAIAKSKLRTMLKKEGYPKSKRDDFAAKMAERGKHLTEDEVRAIINDSADTPEPEPGPTSHFPSWQIFGALLLCLLPSAAQAEWTWPMQDEPQWAAAWPEPARRARIIQLRDHVCVHAISDERMLFPRLRESGWRIGPEEAAHIQVVFVEDRPDLARQYGYRGVCPTYVAVVDERVVSRWEGRIPENRIAAMQQQAVSMAR